jgi:hypothetical protein
MNFSEMNFIEQNKYLAKQIDDLIKYGLAEFELLGNCIAFVEDAINKEIFVKIIKDDIEKEYHDPIKIEDENINNYIQDIRHVIHYLSSRMPCVPKDAIDKFDILYICEMAIASIRFDGIVNSY